jgi:hypothetical protein
MRQTRLLLGLIAAITLSGCGDLAGTSPTAQPAGAATRAVEQRSRFVTLTGMRLQHAAPFLGVADTNFAVLRSMIDTKTGEIAHQLYVEDSYFGAERNWNAARDMSGQPLRFIAISKNEITCENGCSYAEEFAAVLPEALLRANPQGLTVVFTARSGATKTIAVPGAAVASHLAALGETRAALPATAAASPAPQAR